MDPYSPYNKGKRAQKSRQVGTDFRGCFEGFSCCCWVVQEQSVQQTVWHNFKVHIFLAGWVIQQYGLGTFFEAEIFGTVLGVVSIFLLAGNCVIVVDMYFPEAE
jgi:hypothetical protein